MSRKIKQKNVDSLLRILVAIKMNQCSKSKEDLIFIDEIINKIQLLKTKKGSTNEQILKEFVKVVNFLEKFFKD